MPTAAPPAEQTAQGARFAAPPPAPSSLRLLYIATFLTSLPLGSFDVLLALYAQSLNASETAIGALFAVFAAAGLALRPLAGLLADRGHARLMLIAGAAAHTLSMGLYASAASYPALVAARVTQAVGSIALSLALYVLVAASTAAHERGSSFGRLSSITFSGILTGGVLAGLMLLRDTDTQQSIRAQLTALGLALPLPAPTDRLAALHLLYGLYAVGGLAALPAAITSWQTLPGKRKEESENRKAELFSLSSFLFSHHRLLLVGLLLGMGYNMAVPVLPSWFSRQFGASLAPLALAYLIPGVLYAALPGRLGRRADRWGVARATIAGLLLRALVYLLLPLSATVWLVGLLFVVEAAGYSLSSPAIQALISRATPDELRGTFYSLYSVAAGLGAVAGGASGGWLYEHVSPNAPFWGLAALLAGAAVVLPRTTEPPLAVSGGSVAEPNEGS